MTSRMVLIMMELRDVCFRWFNHSGGSVPGRVGIWREALSAAALSDRRFRPTATAVVQIRPLLSCCADAQVAARGMQSSCRFTGVHHGPARLQLDPRSAAAAATRL